MLVHLLTVIANPLFEVLYRFKRRKSLIPRLGRRIQLYSTEQQHGFDELLDSTMSMGPNTLIEHLLSYPIEIKEMGSRQPGHASGKVACWSSGFSIPG